MGFWLWKSFQAQKSYTTDDATEVWDLPKKGILSNLMLEFYAVAGTANVDVYLADAVTKVEVIGNGSTVIQSLTGEQLKASMAYDDGRMAPDKERSPSGGCYGYFDIRFGRFPGDTKYALDCSRWDSLELKITYSAKAGATIDTTGFKTTTVDMALYGLYSPDGVGLSPVGYIKKEQKKTYTTSASGTEDLALPTDYPFRRLLLVMTTHAYVTYNGFNYVTIDINNGARKPIDNMLGRHLMNFDNGLRGNPVWCHSKHYYNSTAQTEIHPPLGWVLAANPVSQTGTLNGSTTTEVNRVVVQHSVAGALEVDIYGWCPNRALAIDLEKWSGKDGKDAMMDCWGFDQTADIHFQHTQGSADLAEAVVLEQYATK